MYNTKRIELIVKDWVKLKTGLELSDKTISQMVADITETKQCDIHVVGKQSELLIPFQEYLRLPGVSNMLTDKLRAEAFINKRNLLSYVSKVASKYKTSYLNEPNTRTI